jgi:conjugative transfer signal peptidase TraF
MVERPELPLFAYEEKAAADIRAARCQRARLHRHFAAAGVGIGLIVSAALDPPLPRLVWNASTSAPVGLYSVEPGARVKRGDMVIAWPPSAMRRLAAERQYLPLNVPLVKRVVGVSGDRVCASGVVVSLNGGAVAIRRFRDSAGRAVPWWSGCITLQRGALFLVMTGTADSFDGRYFGPTDPEDVIGKATPLWVR